MVFQDSRSPLGSDDKQFPDIVAIRRQSTEGAVLQTVSEQESIDAIAFDRAAVGIPNVPFVVQSARKAVVYLA
jgi:hypothetical protein